MHQPAQRLGLLGKCSQTASRDVLLLEQKDSKWRLI
jgi:hypothetical protein